MQTIHFLSMLAGKGWQLQLMSCISLQAMHYVAYSMRKNLQTVVNYILEQHRDYSLYMDNIALHASKITSPESFDGLTCTAYQHYKASKVYFPNNFFCAKQSSSPDLANSKTQVCR